MTNALGATWHYSYDPLGNLTESRDPVATTTVTYNAWGQPLTITDGNTHTTSYQYDTYSNRIHTIDAATHVTTSTFDIVGREQTYTDANGHTVSFGYDGNDNITSITDPKNHVTSFTYNRNNLLLSSTDRRNVQREYRYDVNLKLIAERDHPNALWTTYGYDKLYRRTVMTDTLGFQTHYAYDPVGQLESLTDANGGITRYQYDPHGNLTALIDGLGSRTTMEYDAANRLAATTDGAGHRVRFCYDTEDRLISRNGPRAGEITQYQYDALDRLISMIDPQGNRTSYEHDPVGNRTAEISPLLYRSDYHYDVLNRLEMVERPTLADGTRPTTHFSYDPVGNTLVITSPRGFTTRFTYDENDNTATITDPQGGRTSYSYDEEDHPTRVTDANGHTTSTTYNPVGLPETVTDGRGFTTRLEYNAAYSLIRTVDPLGQPTQYAYDPMRRLIKQTDALGHDTLYKRDLLGRVTAMSDANGNTTHYNYDALGRLLGVTDALAGVTRYEYDEVGNLTAMSDANQHTTRFSYNLLNELLAETNPLGNTWRYAYDPDRRLNQRIDAQVRPTSYEYDSNNRLVGMQYGAPANEQAPVTFAYDLDGNQTQMCDGLGCTSHTYDARGQRISTTDWLGRTVRHGYDAVGNAIEMTYPNNKPVRYEYDGNNQLVGLTDQQGATSIYKRDALSRVTNVQHPNNVLATFSYDAASRLTALDNRRIGASQPQSAYAYTLDKAGNRVEVTETRAVFDGSPLLAVLKHSYAYDALNRLVRAATDGPNSDTSYRFDAVGNREAKSGTVLAPDPGTPQLPVAPRPEQTASIYNEANQLLKAGDSSFSYSANGDRTSETRQLPNGKTETTDYAYDREDRLISVVKRVSGAVTMEAHYEYDGYGRRARKTVSYPGKADAITTFLYDGLDIIGARFAQGNNVSESYFYLAPSPLTGLRRPVEIEIVEGGNSAPSSGSRFWYQHDGLDSIIALTDEQGKLVSPMLYDEYGQHLAGTSDLALFTYTAQDYDVETGLLHFYARYYDPQRGVWLTQDAYRGHTAQPGTLHRYGYVGNRPTLLADAYGYFWPAVIAVVVVVAVVIDYGWTAYDAHEDAKTLADPEASLIEKEVASFSLTSTVILEVAEPDEFSPLKLPIDDIVRRKAKQELKEKLEKEALEKAIKNGLNRYNDLRKKYDNILNHLTDDDLSAAIRELNGEIVKLRPDGNPYDHVNEVRDAQRGLINLMEEAKKELSNPNLPQEVRKNIENLMGQASDRLDYTEKFVPR